jgi:hypothetical protein
MRDVLCLAVGVAGGFVLARFLIEPSSCCRVVANGVRDKVGSTLGPGAQALGDGLGLWSFTPAFAGWF